LGSGLTANWKNQSNASGLYLAFDMMFSFASTSALLFRPLHRPQLLSSCDVQCDFARAPDAAPTG